MAKTKPRVPHIKTGHRARPQKRWTYPFETLQKKDDWFGVADMARENSVRAQASKNMKARGVKYRVQRVTKGEEPYKLAADGVVVIFDSYQPS
jgi:hypothetical protein